MMNKTTTLFARLVYFVIFCLLLPAVGLSQIIKPNQSKAMGSVLSETGFTWSTGSTTHAFPNLSISTDYIIAAQPQIDPSIPGIYAIEIEITGAGFAGDGASFGMASFPLVNNNHQIGFMSKEWGAYYHPWLFDYEHW